MSRGSIVVCRPHRAREASALAPARAVGRSLVWKVMAYGMALNKRRAEYRRSVEYAKMRAQAESDMLADQIMSTATSYAPIGCGDAYYGDAYYRMMVQMMNSDMAVAAARREQMQDSVNEHEYARAKKRSEPDIAEAWGD